MISRLIIYYALMLPVLFSFLFGSDLLKYLLLIFFVLATTILPYDERFLEKSLKKFPSFLVLTLILTALVLLALDLVNFFMGFSNYALVLMIFPAYLVFRLLSLPWIFMKEGFSSPLLAFKTKQEDDWLILAVLSFLAITSKLTLLPLLLAAPASYFLAANLRLSPE